MESIVYFGRTRDFFGDTAEDLVNDPWISFPEYWSASLLQSSVSSLLIKKCWRCYCCCYTSFLWSTIYTMMNMVICKWKPYRSWWKTCRGDLVRDCHRYCEDVLGSLPPGWREWSTCTPAAVLDRYFSCRFRSRTSFSDEFELVAPVGAFKGAFELYCW